MSYLEERRNRKSGLSPALPTKKEKKPIAKKSPKKIAEEKAERERLGGGDTELIKWYKARIKMMTGFCNETGLKTETKIYKYAIASICHLLPKSTCPSVKTHPLNWIELNCDFHTKFDSMSWEEREKLGCWQIIHERLIHVWECLAPEERRFFPDNVRNFIEKHDPFQ